MSLSKNGNRPAPNAERKPSSLVEAAKMLAPRWPVAVVAIGAIVLFALGNLARPLVIQRAIDDGLIADNGRVVVIAAVVFLCIALGVYVAQAASTYSVNWLGQNFLRDLRIRLFSHLQRLSMSFFDGENSGRLMARMTADVNALQDLLNHGLLMVVQSALLLVGTVVILFTLNWRLSLVALVILPPLVVATAVFRVYSARAYEAVRDRIAEVLVHMQESFSGMRVVQAFARERHNIERFGDINEQNFEANVRTVRLSSMYIPFIEWLGGLGIGIILYFGGRWVIGDTVTVGTVAAFIFYLEFIFQPIQHLSQLYDMFQSAVAALNKIFRLLAVEPDVREPDRPARLPQYVSGRIDFDGVTFGYAPETPVLHDIDLTIEPGQRVALVGATGAGKSTMAKLALRFYDPTSGRVRLDGVDLRDVRSEELRRAITLVP
ncbi:MAG: ABC transporter transmembrane domain-containing protein, partial [Dehalococcoidia bacterium]|nr:ABC transporter transmembrane domain-containing protein [Dehalococcoidia bacterium]